MKGLMARLLILALIFTLGGCAPKEPEEERAMPKWEEYEDRLQRPLFELATSEDPAAYAEKRQLDYFKMVRVVIELAPEAELPEGFLILEESRMENRIQALVPLEELLELAKQPQIEYIRVPAKPKF
jgi:hypothetical protein